ncbi:MAG: hypothetical protein HUK08_04935, partial [Bacteroidaceae bacterium]|nr:hypothetical protein [Bacteroidaceae bacterium]
MGLLVGIGETKPTFPFNCYYGIKIPSYRTSHDWHLQAVNPELMTEESSPIWTRIRSFVENHDGSVKYYLDKYDSRFKQGGSAQADLTGHDGNVMVEIPAYYMKIEERDGDLYRLYSDYALPGFFYVPRRVIGKFMASVYTGTTVANTAYVQNGAISNCMLKWASMTYQSVPLCGVSPIARRTITEGDVTMQMPDFVNMDTAKLCRGGNNDATKDDKHNSLLGMCRTTHSRTNFRDDCNRVNTAHSVTDDEHMMHIGMYHIYNEIAWLMRCEYKVYDIQKIDTNVWGGDAVLISSGDWSSIYGYYPFIPNGTSAPLGDRTGYVTIDMPDESGTMHTYKCKSYRGIENPIQYIWQLSDDLLIYNNGNQTDEGSYSRAYVCHKPSQYATPGDSNPETWAVDHGYVNIAELPRHHTDSVYYAWIDRESFANNGMSLPMDIDIDGEVHDYYYWGTVSGWFGSFFGG